MAHFAAPFGARPGRRSDLAHDGSARSLGSPQMRRRNHWGWGYEDEVLSAEQLGAAGPTLGQHLGIEVGNPMIPKALTCCLT